MTNKELLISHINLFSEEDIAFLLDAVILMETKCTLTPKPNCPYCGSHAIMSNSHFPPKVWREVIKDTIQGNAIDYTAQRIGCSHQTVFDMRHKILMSRQQPPEISGVFLGGVSEYVPDCYKGKELGGSIPRNPRKHGAKAVKRGISNEYVCICTGIQRNGDAITATINRTKPSAAELVSIFDGHITDGMPALCDGLRSYHAFPGIADCTVKDCNDRSAAAAYRNAENVIRRLTWVRIVDEYGFGPPRKQPGRPRCLTES